MIKRDTSELLCVSASIVNISIKTGFLLTELKDPKIIFLLKLACQGWEVPRNILALYTMCSRFSRTGGPERRLETVDFFFHTYHFSQVPADET